MSLLPTIATRGEVLPIRKTMPSVYTVPQTATTVRPATTQVRPDVVRPPRPPAVEPPAVERPKLLGMPRNLALGGILAVAILALFFVRGGRR